MEKLGWSPRKQHLLCQLLLLAEGESSEQCESQTSSWVGPSGHSAFSPALADLKNGQTEALASGVLYPLGLKSLGMWLSQEKQDGPVSLLFKNWGLVFHFLAVGGLKAMDTGE